MDSNFITESVQKWLYKHSNPIQATNFCKWVYREADILSISKAGLVTEIEVKISIEDYRRDFQYKTFKHALMDGKAMDRLQRLPNYFYFAMPRQLWETISKGWLPGYAGYFVVEGDGQVNKEVSAGKLHKRKAPLELYQAIAHNLTAESIFGCQYMTYLNKQNKNVKTIV